MFIYTYLQVAQLNKLVDSAHSQKGSQEENVRMLRDSNVKLEDKVCMYTYIYIYIGLCVRVCVCVCLCKCVGLDVSARVCTCR